MADELRDDNIVELTRLTIRKVLLEQERKLNATDENRVKQINAAIKQIENETAKRKSYIQIGNQTIGQIEKEITKKKELQKSYEEQVKIIQQSNKSIREQNEAIKKLQESMAVGGNQKVRDTTSTFGTIISALKGFNFKEVATTWTSAKGAMGLASNSIKALGGYAAASAAGLGLIAKGAQMFWANVVVPSARMRNLAGQQLGIGAESRNLMGGRWIGTWADRTLLGYSAEQQRDLYSGLVSAMRLNPETYKGNYQTALTGMMGVQKLWGTDTGTLSKIYKGYIQSGVAADKLATKFDGLMRNVEGTGWTTSEYAGVMAKNIMYLKNFGVNLDTYSKHLRKYGRMIEEEIISPESLAPGVYKSESMGNLAFMTQSMLRSGLVSEEELGVGVNATPVELAGAGRRYLATGGIEAMQKVVQAYLSSPEISALLQSMGAFNSSTGFTEALLSGNLPMSSAIANFIRSSNMTPEQVEGLLRYGITGGTEPTATGGKTQDEIVKEAMKNVAQTTESGIEALLRSIAAMIKQYLDSKQGRVKQFGG